MKKHKNKIIAIAVIIVALLAAWFFGGSFPDRSEPVLKAPQLTVSGPSAEAGSASADPSADVTIPPSETPDVTESRAVSPPPGDNTETPDTGNTDVPDDTSEATPKPTETPAQTTPMMEINPDTGKDRYLTDPVPEGKPLPVEPEAAVNGDGSFTVTLTVRCDTILDNMSLLDKEKHELVPEDGVIFPVTAITVYEGESVFNALQRTMKQYKIHMAHRHTPIYNSAYIEAINNLYEFDVGELSGWMYCVNDWYPNYGCSRYQLKPGDVIEWRYTCDLGRDLGQYWVTGG